MVGVQNNSKNEQIGGILCLIVDLESMKKVFSIIIAVIMLGSGMKVSIDRHYCGGKLAATKISVTGKLASCGMETLENRNSNQLSFENKCCEDQLSYYSISDKFIPEQFKSLQQSAGKDIPSISGLNIIFNSFDHYDFNIRVLPPGDRFKSGVSLSQICVLRI